jgi:NifU-like protein involved in Fe-S cluster formation
VGLGIYDYFARACRREIGVFGVEGAAVFDAEGNTARFWITLSRGIIRRVQYKCTTCVTLVALCEHLSEMAEGQEPAAALRLGEGQLLAAHPDVPPERRDRAALAVSALQSAVRQTTKEISGESSVHLLNPRPHSLL